MDQSFGVTRLTPPRPLAHVQVGYIRHDVVRDHDDLLRSMFHHAEREEWRECRHPGRQAEWLGVRICLKQMLSSAGDRVDPREIVIRKNRRGRPRVICESAPRLAAGDCSLSHAGPWSVAAWTPQGQEKVGVDVERVSPRLHRAAGAFVSAEDYAIPGRESTEQLAIWWTLKEAASKVLGEGLGAGFAEIRCIENEHGLQQVIHASGLSMVGWNCFIDDYVISVCGCPAGA